MAGIIGPGLRPHVWWLAKHFDLLWMVSLLLCSSIGWIVNAKVPHMEHPEHLLSKEARKPKMFFAAQSWLSSQTLHSLAVGVLQAEMSFSETLVFIPLHLDLTATKRA